MIKKYFPALLFLIFAFTVLLTSVMRTASVKYDFKGESCLPSADNDSGKITINYNLPYPGRIIPDSILWPIKALRDRIWLFITADPGRKADIKLLFADKRIGMALLLFEKGDADRGFSTITKAEKYLEEAYRQGKANKQNGCDTIEFNQRLTHACLKHYQMMESMIEVSPEDAKPKIVELQNYPKAIYFLARNDILEQKGSEPINPFNWQ